ncbi:hypothetical protein SeMB42_g00967 [Synchytrium endobioticum]|uniref:Uncharacterized protein n=1 Tax=Synchytrium endobioticum TaxID=286115 RepID=A0A507DBE2_9FUNG|nr:hypothetical protein SeLEV6574_g01735 [Synchytrium endobioticum]TPX53154.1 hypothetical protein SeMB42_g00967 [Synchytrium endobioticum]
MFNRLISQALHRQIVETLANNHHFQRFAASTQHKVEALAKRRMELQDQISDKSLDTLSKNSNRMGLFVQAYVSEIQQALRSFLGRR